MRALRKEKSAGREGGGGDEVGGGRVLHRGGRATTGTPFWRGGWADACFSHVAVLWGLDPAACGILVFVAGRGSRERKRRRRLRASVFALALLLGLGPGWALWAAVWKASGPVRGPQRRLLGSLLQVRPSLPRRLCGCALPFPLHGPNRCPGEGPGRGSRLPLLGGRY